MQETLLKLSAVASVLVATVISAGSAQALTFNGSGGRVPEVGSGGSGTSNNTFRSRIDVTEQLNITGLSVTLNELNHTRSRDLVTRLIYKNGSEPTTSIQLFSKVGGKRDLGGTYIFQDGGQRFPGRGNSILEGTYTPKDSFANAFYGGNSAGRWILRIDDRRGGDVGSLSSWTLNIDGEPVTPVPTPAAVLPALFGMGTAAIRKQKTVAEANQEA